MRWEIVGTLAIIVFTFGMIFLARGVGKRMTSTSDEDIARIEKLQATGGKARAARCSSSRSTRIGSRPIDDRSYR